MESESDDENRVGLDILPIKNQRLYCTEEDEIILGTSKQKAKNL